jgi:hypothetical protein
MKKTKYKNLIFIIKIIIMLSFVLFMQCMGFFLELKVYILKIIEFQKQCETTCIIQKGR